MNFVVLPNLNTMDGIRSDLLSKVYAPASKPQELFLTTPDWVDICFYGGLAGGGVCPLYQQW